MATEIALTKNNLSNLTCSVCKKYLSIAPICMNKGKFICGRCGPIGEHVTIYEELAQFMTFPCSNAPCNVQIKWVQVKSHELTCPYKPVICPKINCNACHLSKDLYHHFSNEHPELLFSNGDIIKRRLRDMPFSNFNRDKKAYLLKHSGQSYLFMVYGTCKEDRYDPGSIYSYSYSFGVFYLSQTNPKQTHYDLTVTITDDDGIKTDYSWYDEPMKEFDHNEHCLGCLDQNCLVGHQGKRRMFLWNRIENLVNESNYVMTYSVTIVEPKNTVRTDAALATKLECPICCEYFTTPIYICSNGHSVCSNCKKRRNRCAFCSVVIGNSRNYVLEEISDSLQICCPNAPKGCKYVGVIKSTKQHFNTCRF